MSAELFAECAREARSILEVLKAGRRPEAEQLGTFGTAVSDLLRNLMRQHEATSRYWSDGVLVDVVALRTDRTIAATGRMWCADHRDQWLVPISIDCVFGSDETLTSMRFRLGDAAIGTLADHRGRNITRREPQQWLFDLDVNGVEAR